MSDAAFAVPDGLDEAAFRTAENADFIARLAPILRERIRENGMEKVYAEIELPLIPILADIELTGMKVDGESLKNILRVYFKGAARAAGQDHLRSPDVSLISGRQNRSARYLAS